jgi:hypothetical protein
MEREGKITGGLKLQVFQGLIDQECRPHHGFEKTQNAEPEGGSLADEIYRCTDKTQPIDSSGSTTMNDPGPVMMVFVVRLFSIHNVS